MQRDLHFNATLALCVRAGYEPEEAKLIAWANYQTDCWRGSQVKWNSFCNPGPYFHFVQKLFPRVQANSSIVQDLVKNAKTPIQLGIALHTFQDSYSHAGFVGRMDKRNVMGLGRGYWLLPPYGHTQMLKQPDRCEVTWTDTRTGEVKNNRLVFKDALLETAKLLELDATDFKLQSIVGGVWNHSYDSRKQIWAAQAGMPDIRFSKIKGEYWKRYGKEFKAAAKRQKKFLQS